MCNVSEKMSDKKRSRRRKDEYTGPGGVQEEQDKPSKEEYAVAKWLKNNVRTKRTKFLSHNVEYFTATKALDALMNSKFSDGDNCLFPTREHAIEFLDLMLEHKFFHRAKKVPVFLEDLKSGGNCGSSCGVSSSGGGKSKIQQKESSSAAASSTTTTVSTTNTSSSSNVSGGAATTQSTTTVQSTVTKRDIHKDDKDKDKSDNLECCAGQVSEGCTGSGGGGGGVQGEEQTKEKRKRKIKLDMHPEQVFVDGSEAYVWIYDPVPIHYWIYGMALVLGAILLCLFPLWPPILRKGVYYLSVAAAGFLVFILVLTIVRLIIFVIVWILSGGKLYFWIFPNLTEDVGFLASFWPLYESEYYVESGGSSKSNKKSKKKKKDKDSDAEDEVTVSAGKSGGGGGGNPHKRTLILEAEKIENIKENERGSIPPSSSSRSDLSDKGICNDDDNVNTVDQDYDDDDDDDNYKGDDDYEDDNENGESEGNGVNNDRDNDDNLNKKKKKISKINLSNIKNDDKTSGKSTATNTVTTTSAPSADKKENTTPSESESEGSRSSTGKDFEILDATEVADDADAET